MFKRIVPIFFIILAIGAGGFILTNQQEIVDQVTVSRAVIDPEVTQLAVDSGMNDRGIFLYHAATPKLKDAEGFNQSCTRQEERSAILGCYVNDTIYIYDIKDDRLSGVREVTATHEALHAIYARTSDSDRARLEPLLEAEYERVVVDKPELADRMAYYERTQPGERTNELHSIVGTEFLGLSGELEEYYSMYFEDRARVVQLHQQYEHRFDELRGETDRLAVEIEQLKVQINAMNAEYDAALAALNARIGDFNNRANAGYFTSQSAFNSERNALLAESDRIDVYGESIRQNILVHNQKVEEYKLKADESNSLYEALDSNLEPSPQI